MKGHDGLCPTPNPHIVERKHCAYCNLIDSVRDHYKDKKAHGKDKTYDEGFSDGWTSAIAKLQELNGVQEKI